MEGKALNFFRKYISLNIPKKILITYFLCWTGFLFSFSIGKLFVYLSSILKSKVIEKPAEIAQDVGVAKFSAVSTAVSHTMGANNVYLTLALSYIISNYSGCLIIVFAFGLLAYLCKRDEEKVESIKEKEECFKTYQKYLLILFIFAVINPLTGLVGVNLSYYDLIAVIPHGFFEFFGFATAVVAGVELANKIYPIVKRKLSYEKIAIVMLISFIFIFLAGMLEPIDWLIYEYAKTHNIPLEYAFLKAYSHIIPIIYSLLRW